MRVEQVYPFPFKALLAELARFPQAEIVWCHEEPRQMGYWSFVEPPIEFVLRKLDGAAKSRSMFGASPPF